MKKKINIFFGITITVFLSLIIWLNYLKANSIGDITFDSKIDDPLFTVCNEERIFQYYSAGIGYKGGRKVIREKVFEDLVAENLKLEKKSGYITFRFIVNCQKETGRFRVKMINENLKETIFKDTEIKKLKKSIKKLKEWQSGKIENGPKIDYYYQINFKIESGKIIDIF